MTSPILVLGGTGTVGSRIARQLAAASIPALIASRSGNDPSPAHNHLARGVPFDWENRDTWSNPFQQAASDAGEGSGDGAIKSVYLVAPPISVDIASVMMDFVDFARERGARRFVLQSASAIEAGGPAMGKVHAYLRELGTRGAVDWAVLRPSWFQQNFSEHEAHVRSIRDESKIYSATGDGKIPWVSADDIAAVAVEVLTRKEAPNTEYLVLGPELLSYGDVAKILSNLLGRRIVHVDLSNTEYAKRHESFGMPENYANMLHSLDTAVKFGAENRTNDVVLSMTGIKPGRFLEMAEAVKSVWGPVDTAA